MNNFNTISKPKSLIIDCNSLGDSNLKEFVIQHAKNIDEYSPKISKSDNHVLLIGGGMSSEREVSYMSCNGIVRSLIELGKEVTFVDMGEDIAAVLAKINPIVVFNGLHGTYGEDGCLSGLLNIMKIPYTGCGVLSSSIAFNKKKSLDVFKSNGIKTAKSIIVAKSEAIKHDPMARPYVIKPISQGSSVGVELVFPEDKFNFADYDFPYGEEILVEEYIKGREIQVAVLNGKALGTLEIKLLKGKRFYDYETKYVDGFSEHLCPAPLDHEVNNKALEMAEKVAYILGANGMVRVEFLYQVEEKQFYILELNTLPGMTPLSICPEIAFKTHGITYTEIVNRILADAKFES